MNRTNYFAPDVRPSRPGFYEARLLGDEWDDGEAGRHLWDGTNWFLPIFRGRHDIRLCQCEGWHWRGLAEPAK